MKIAQSMPGIEGLLIASTPAHAGTGQSKISFAESLGESLASAVAPGGVEPALEPDKLPGKGERTDSKPVGKVAKDAVESIPLSVIPKGIHGADASAASTTKVEVEHGMDSDAGTIPMPVMDAAKTKQASTEKEPIGEVAQADSSDQPIEMPEGDVGDAPRTNRPPAMKDGNVPKETGKHAQVQGVAARRGKQTEASSRHKEKPESENVPKSDQASPQNLQMETSPIGQPPVAAEVQAVAVAVSQASPGEPSRSSSIQGKEAAVRSAGKPIGIPALREKQNSQPTTRSTQAPQLTAGAPANHPLYAISREVKPDGSAPPKVEATAHRPASKDGGQDTAKVAVPQLAGAGVPAIPTHASVTPPAERMANGAAAPTVQTHQVETIASHPAYASGDHGTIAATPTALEVGVPGGSHGWLKVRAELGGDGTVHASMQSNSAAGTEALRRELPQLTSFLHQEQVRVSAVVVHAPQSSAELSNQASNDGRGQAMSGGSPDANRGDSRGGSPGSDPSQARVIQRSSTPDTDGDLLLPRGFGSAGGWLSVRA